MEQEKILFVINQKSGAAARNDTDLITEKLVKSDRFHDFYILTGNNDEEHIMEKIKSFKPGIVVAAGGDGTINMVASVIRGLPVKMGIIPFGSANGLAFELGIPANPEDARELIISGKAKPMDVVKINEDHISLHLCDVGINARIVKEFEKEGKRGFAGYIRHFLKELARPQRSFRCYIRIDNKLYTHKSLMTIIANASSYRTGANMNPSGKIDDGKFEIVVIKPHRKWAWKSFIGAFTGTLDKQPHIETYACESAVININPPQDFQVDGEILGKQSEIRASIQKHALNVILPVLVD